MDDEVLTCPDCAYEIPRRKGDLASESWRGVRQRMFKHRRKSHTDVIAAEQAEMRRKKEAGEIVTGYFL